MSYLQINARKVNRNRSRELRLKKRVESLFVQWVLGRCWNSFVLDVIEDEFE